MSIYLLSELHYKLIMNEKPQKKGRTQLLAGSYHLALVLMWQHQALHANSGGAQFWAFGHMPLSPATAGLLALSTKSMMRSV